MKWLITTSLMTLSVFAVNVYADPATPDQCQTILNLSDSDFNQQAATYSATLNSCAQQNSCSQIDGITNCGALLANRVFTSNFQAALSGGQSNTVAQAAPEATPAAQTTTVAPQTNSTNNNNNNQPTYLAPAPTNSTSSTTKTNSINWF